MVNKLKKIIEEATREVFEQMAFVEVLNEEELAALNESGESVIQQNSTVQVQGTLTFSGRFEGTISVAYSNHLAKTLAANILGLEMEEIRMPEDVVDSVREFTNMVSGNILTRLTESGEPVDLSIPKVGMVDSESDFMEDDSAVVVKLDAEGEPVLSKLQCSVEELGLV